MISPSPGILRENLLPVAAKGPTKNSQDFEDADDFAEDEFAEDDFTDESLKAKKLFKTACWPLVHGRTY